MKGRLRVRTECQESQNKKRLWKDMKLVIFLIQQFSVSKKQNGKGFGISQRNFSVKYDTESH